MGGGDVCSVILEGGVVQAAEGEVELAHEPCRRRNAHLVRTRKERLGRRRQLVRRRRDGARRDTLGGLGDDRQQRRLALESARCARRAELHKGGLGEGSEGALTFSVDGGGIDAPKEGEREARDHLRRAVGSGLAVVQKVSDQPASSHGSAMERGRTTDVVGWRRRAGEGGVVAAGR
jgi:hypothetical protein